MIPAYLVDKMIESIYIYIDPLQEKRVIKIDSINFFAIHLAPRKSRYFAPLPSSHLPVIDRPVSTASSPRTRPG